MNRQRIALLAIATITAGAAVTLAPGEAQAARRSSLAGSPLIYDFDDAYMFPQSIFGHELTLDVDMYPSSSAFGALGSGGIVLGNSSMALGVLTHRFDMMEATTLNLVGLGDVAFPGTGVTSGLLNGGAGGPGATPVQFLDILYAGGSESAHYGLRLSVGLGQSRAETEADFDDSGTETSSPTYTVNLVGGYTTSSASAQTDLSVDLGLAISNTNTLDKDPGIDTNKVTANYAPSLTLGGRHMSHRSDTLDFGMLGALSFGTARTTPWEPDPDEPDDGDIFHGYVEGWSQISLYLGGGPVYHLSDRATVSTDLGFGLTRASHDPLVSTDLDVERTDLDKTKTMLILFPGFRATGEFAVSRRLTLRSGIRGNHFFSSERVEQFANAVGMEDSAAGDGDDTAESSNGSTFYWTSGIGVDLGELTIDGSFNTAFVNNGPYFLSGAGSSPMFALVSLRYEYGRAGRTESSQTTWTAPTSAQ